MCLIIILDALINIIYDFKKILQKRKTQKTQKKKKNNINILKKRRRQKIKEIYKIKINEKKTQTCICHAICPKMDNDNRFNGLVLPLAHGWAIWYFSYLHIFTSYYAFFNQYYVLCFFGLGSFGTSLNYWKYPLHNSWRRYIDIAFIQLSFYVHMYYALIISSGYGYMFFTGTGIVCYGISNLYTTKNIYFATFFHILLHIFASIGNAVLYSGTVKM